MASLISPVLQVLVLISTSATTASSQHHRHKRSGQASVISPSLQFLLDSFLLIVIQFTLLMLFDFVAVDVAVYVNVDASENLDGLDI